MSKAKYLARLLPSFIILALCMPFFGIIVIEGSKILGLRSIPVYVAGTGSMYPSLFWSTSEGGPEDETHTLIPEYRTTPHLFFRFQGLSWGGKQYFKSQIGHGDLVAFKNSQTSAILQAENKDPEIGFIKRVIAIPGDTLELRDGFVYLNDSLLPEPYLSSSRSTYGGTTLEDCQSLTIPAGQYFVMGDNRKISSDSRFELGLVAESDITHFLPYAKQQVYHSLYHDTTPDPTLLGQPTLDTSEFITLLNSARRAKSLPSLKLVPTLSRSAAIQGEQVLLNPTHPLALSDSTSRANYTNILLGQFISHGHYNSQELLENLLYHPQTSTQIFNHRYTDIGLAVIHREVDGCPRQVIVGQLGGYIPPVYDSAARESYRRLTANLLEVIPSWEQALGHEEIDQSKLQELLTILHRRLDLSREVEKAMDNNQWLSESLKKRIDADNADAATATRLSNELNQE